ncbi:sensor histidine kinase [Microbacterium panaciterrae]|uniref:histidine kinase n=1 Tax=Microbacterium panaciterrae TaxID=985759 RepID=A0ABP8P178_9MICO
MTRINPLTWWSAGINLAGALAVGYGLWRAAPGTAAWVVWAAAAGLVAWVVRTLLAVRRGSESERGVGEDGPAIRTTAAVLVAVMVLTGSVTAVPSQGPGVALLIVAVLVMTSDPETPVTVWGGVVLVGILGIAAGALLSTAGVAGPARANVFGLLAALAAPLAAVVVGSGRRAQRVLLAERERASMAALKAQATAARVAIARDLHDVLAHSLGGLVVQLDAAEALLDAGDAGSAAARVAAARRLAVDGLREAREAVRTLREPADGDSAHDGAALAGSIEPAELAARIEALIHAHEPIAGGIELVCTGAGRALPVALAEALVRAVQEGLSNARKHAPGSAVHIGLIWHPDRVDCIVENPVSSASGGTAELAATGGGYGLRGVRERFAALGGTVTAGVVAGPSTGSGTGSGSESGRFVLRVEAPA